MYAGIHGALSISELATLACSTDWLAARFVKWTVVADEQSAADDLESYRCAMQSPNSRTSRLGQPSSSVQYVNAVSPQFAQRQVPAWKMSRQEWEFPKIGVPFFGVLITKFLLFRVLS